jgi:hypothetical protein
VIGKQRTKLPVADQLVRNAAPDPGRLVDDRCHEVMPQIEVTWPRVRVAIVRILILDR